MTVAGIRRRRAVPQQRAAPRRVRRNVCRQLMA